MSVCHECKEEVDELVSVRIGGKTRRLCEDCAERLEEEGIVAKESESVIQEMLGMKGRR